VGHQRVLGRCVERARDLASRPIVFTFHPHPLELLRPAETPPLLQTFGQKLEIMRGLGVEAVLWPRDMEAVLAMPPEEFLDKIVCGSLQARAMVEGADFHFGAGAAGDRERLLLLGRERNLDVVFVEDALVDGERISSTRIRRLLSEGRVAEAARCLGRPFTYLGTVVEGHQRGTGLGFPTVNVDAPRFLVPGEGVYAGWALVRGGRYMAAISVGRLPTFHREHPVVVEAFLLDFEGEVYGEQIALEFVDRLRPQQTFPDAEALRRQVAADGDRVRAILGQK